MVNSLRSFRESRPRTSVKGFTVQPDLLPAPETLANGEPVMMTAYEHLARKNPALNDLVASLDLIETGNPSLVQVVRAEVPQHKSVSSPADRERLRSLATNTLEQGTSYSRPEAIDKIMVTTGVTRERAENGLNLMLEETIVSLTSAGTYFLSDTVPF